MKKVLISTIGLLLLSATPGLAAWTFGTTFGATNESEQFIEIDPNGLIWATDYGVPGTAGLDVFDQDGNVQFSGKITDGLDTDGSPIAFSQSGGVAYNPNDGLMYAVGHYAGAPDLLSRYNITTGAGVNGIRLNDTLGVAVTSPGDIDFDDAGNLVLVRKVSAEWWFYAAASIANPITSASATYQYGSAGWHLNRGCSVSPDGTKVYLADESEDDVDIWTGTPAGGYTDSGSSLDNTAGGNQAACETDAAGNVYVSCSGTAQIQVYNSSDAFVETIADAELLVPRGVAVDSTSGYLFTAQFSATPRQIAKFYDPLTVEDWASY